MATKYQTWTLAEWITAGHIRTYPYAPPSYYDLRPFFRPYPNLADNYEDARQRVWNLAVVDALEGRYMSADDLCAFVAANYQATPPPFDGNLEQEDIENDPSHSTTQTS